MEQVEKPIKLRLDDLEGTIDAKFSDGHLTPFKRKKGLIDNWVEFLTMVEDLNG